MLASRRTTRRSTSAGPDSRSAPPAPFPREPLADLDQPQLSVVAIFVTGSGTVPLAPTPRGDVNSRGNAPTARAEIAHQAALAMVAHQFSGPMRSRFFHRRDRRGLLSATAA